jgi:hypothetical protein
MAASSLIIRRKTATGEMSTISEEIEDTRPEYLNVFPDALSILKDLKLGVLLGRLQTILV